MAHYWTAIVNWPDPDAIRATASLITALAAVLAAAASLIRALRRRR
jgi:hypothetical protein